MWDVRAWWQGGSPQAQTLPVGWMCVEVMTGDNDAAGF